MKSCVAAILIVCWCLSSPVLARLEVFASFEKSSEVSAVKASPATRVRVSKQFPAWGPQSLKVTFPAAGGSIELNQVPPDWRWQQVVLIYCWSSEPREVEVSVADSAGNSASKAFSLERGVNHLQWKTAAMGKVDLRHIDSLVLSAKRSAVLYLDYFALDRFHPELLAGGRWDVKYSTAVKTPHFPWANPFAGGGLKVFSISPVRDGRGIVELAQRLEMDVTVASIGRSPGINKWGFGDFYRQRSPGGEFWGAAYSLAHAYIAEDLLFGPSYDVIIWPGLHPWQDYPDVIREEIKRRVDAGAGLVLIDPIGEPTDEFSDLSPLIPAKGGGSDEDGALDRSRWKKPVDHYVTRGVALEAFPWGHIGVRRVKGDANVLLETGQGTPVLAVRSFGRGRVVGFSFPHKGLIPEVDDIWDSDLSSVYHEYLWDLMVRAVVWASHRENGQAITGLEKTGSGLRFTLAGVSEDTRLVARVMSSFAEIEGEMEAAVEHGQVVLAFPETLQGGRHFVDARLISDRGVEDWSGLAFETQPAVKIEALELGSDRYRVGEPVTARVELAAARTSNCRIIARLYDNYDRLIDEKWADLNAKGREAHSFQLRSAGVLTHLAKIDCEVLVDGLRSDRRLKEVFVLQPRSWDDYDVTMYRFGTDPMPGIWPAIDRQLRRLNVSTLAAYSLEHSRHANYNIQAQTRISGQESPDGPLRAYYTQMKAKYLETGNKHGLIREYCMNDPAYREQVKQEIRQKLPPWVPFSPTSYYIYEEPSLTCYGDAVDICFSRFCMSHMRNWLKTVYGNLTALNREWGTDFQRWEDVVPDDSDEARARGNYASWADHRTFMERTYAEFFQFVLGEVRRQDPGGILLNSGTQISGSHNGCDYSRINRFTEHLNAYSGGNQLDFHRCFNPNLKISGGAGYGVLGKDVLYNFYGNLFKGANAGAYIFWEYSTLNPDLALCQSGRDMEQGFKELRGEGIGKLVGLAKPDNHGIAIHYSYPSIHGAWIVDGEITKKVSYNTSKTFTRFGEDRNGWVQLLKDAGVQFDFIAYSGIEKDELISKGYRVLVLPMSIALSDAEADAITRFVRQGGTVIADGLTGVMDQHTRFREKPALGEVFGVRSTPANREMIVEMGPTPGLELAGATSLDGDAKQPELLHHRFGEGAAFFLNFFLDGYPKAKLEGTHEALLNKMKRLLSTAGVKPKILLHTSKGNLVKGCATYLFNSGSTRLLGLIPGKMTFTSDRIEILLEENRAAYDVRRRRFLGRGDRFALDLEPALPELLAFVENPVSGLSMNISPTAHLGSVVEVRFAIEGVPELRSVAKVEVIDPSGTKLPIYSGNFDIAGGQGVAHFCTALNDPPGDWIVKVTDVISGVVARGSIRIE